MITTFAEEKIKKKDDCDAIQGSWRIVSGERNGMPETDRGLSRVIYSFAGKKLLIKDGGKVVVEASIKLDSTKHPSQITIVASPDGKEETSDGIYLLEQGSLMLCFARPGRDRPKTFVTRNGDGFGLLVFEPVRESN